MNHPTLILRVRFRSARPLDEIMKVVEARAPDFAALPGLQKKYYALDPASGEIAGIYHWATSEAFDEYRRSALRASVARAYQVVGEPNIEVYPVLKVLRP